MSAAYRRVLLKLSGEALMGDAPFGIDPAVTTQIAKEIAEIRDAGVEVGVVIGGGGCLSVYLLYHSDHEEEHGEVAGVVGGC